MELINGSYKALEAEFLNYLSKVKTEPLDKVLIITQSARLAQNLKTALLSSEECLSCLFWQDILGLVSSVNEAVDNYLPLKQKTALDYFKLKDFLQRHNFNASPGYIQALQASFMDMQNALIMPGDLLKIEELDSSLSSKELKNLIFLYQNYLNLTAQEGKSSYKDFFLTALENIETSKYLSQFKQIIFYGIYDWTSLQYDILKAIGQNYPTALFFPYEEIPSYKYIKDFYLANILGLATTHKKLNAPASKLEAFAKHLFEPAETEQKTYSAPIKIIDTSGLLGQVQSAAKEVLLLHKQGFAYKDIALCARSLEPYKNFLIRVFTQHDIPININSEEAFLIQPLISVCFNLLNIARNNFHKDSVLSFINSPYLKDKDIAWGQLIKDIGVQTGFEQWMSLLDLAIEKGNLPAKTLKDFLIKLQQKVSLLEEAASFALLTQRVKELLNIFLSFETLTEQEQTLFDTFEGILEELSSFDRVRPAGKGEFLEELNFLLEHKKINSVINLQNSLTVADTMSLRGQSFKAVIILGLNEGIFPAKVSEDPVFKDTWRIALQKLGYSIKVSAQRYLEEKLFFYLALSCASNKAILIYQRCDEEGKLKIPSLYLTLVLKNLKEFEKFSLSRRALTQLLEWYKISPDLLTSKEAALLAALEGDFSLAAKLAQTEQEELFLQAFSLSLEGALGAHDLVCKRQGPLWQHILKKGLSPSSLKNLYQCPAKYLFDNILQRQDTDTLQRDSLDPRDKGNLLHKILEQFYSSLNANNLFDKVFSKGALPILQPFIDGELKIKDYRKYGLYPLLWFVLCKEMEEVLKKFVEADLLRIQQGQQKPSYFEQNLTCNLDSLKIHGRLDRIDLSSDKSSFSVIDYKSGEIKGSVENLIFAEGNFQGPLYFELVKALPALSALQPDKMLYASLKTLRFYELSYEEYLTFKDKFWTLVQFLKTLIEEGLFIITPGKIACQHCLYGDICRKNHAASQSRANFSLQAGKLREYRK